MALKRILLFATGVLLIFAVLNYFGLAETINTLAQTRLDLLILAVAVQAAIVTMIIARIKILAYGKGYLSWMQAGRVTLTGMFVSMITPFAKLGGEPLKMYMLRGNIGSNNASAAVAIESIMELVSSLIVVFLVAVVFFNEIPSAYVTTFILFLIVISLSLMILLKIFFTPRWLHRIINWIASKMAKMLEVDKKDYAEMFSTAFYAMWKDRRLVAGALSVSVASKLLEIARLWVLFLAIGIALPLRDVAIIWCIVLVLMFIPWLPGSLGLAEFGAISAVVAFGVASGPAASGILLDRFVSFWLLLAVGMASLYAARRRGELPDLKGLRKK